MIFSLLAGFDPYASAGTLSKLAMASGQAGLLDQNFDNISGDLHGSFDNRVALVIQTIEALCALPTLSANCQSYKQFVHPHIPAPAPLSAGASHH
jgi:hypothetical protein